MSKAKVIASVVHIPYSPGYMFASGEPAHDVLRWGEVRGARHLVYADSVPAGIATAAPQAPAAGAAPTDALEAVLDAFERQERGRLAATIAASLVEELRAAMTAAPAQESEDGWMPIETAPDGERVLLGPRHAPVVGTVQRPEHWHEEQEPTATVVHYNGTTLVAGYRCREWRRLPGAAPAQEAAPLTHAELQEVKRAADDIEDCGETDAAYELLLRAAVAGYLECTRFQVLNQSALDLDAARARQEGGS